MAYLQDEQHLDDGGWWLGLGQQQQVTQLHLQQDQVAETQQGDLADGQLLTLGRREEAGPEVRARWTHHQPHWVQDNQRVCSTRDGTGRGFCKAQGLPKS